MVEVDIGERIQGEMSMKITLELRPKDEGEPVPSFLGVWILGQHSVP